MTAAQPDELVALAQRTWGPRFLAAGIDYADFLAIMSRIQVWEQWLPEWRTTALHYEELAKSTQGPTAAEAWRRAALYWHFAKFVSTENEHDAQEAQRRLNQDYERGLPELDPPGEKVVIPYLGIEMAAILRRPAGPARRPVVILIPGLDSTKEELQPVADYFLRRGLATIAVDGPGQGETESKLNIEAAFEKPVGAVIDYIEQTGDLDGGRIGLYGISLGGYYALRAAAFERRIRAVVENCGPYCLGALWNSFPPMSKGAFHQRSGATDDADARRRALELDLTGLLAGIECPVAVLHGTRDLLVPYADAERIMAELPDVTYLGIEGGNHGCTNRIFEARTSAADWLATKL